jgi:osmoprotectant transport system permease protein
MIKFIGDVFKLYVDRWAFFLELLIEHIKLSGIAVFVITLVGVSIGIYISRNERLASFVISATNFLYTIPSIALFGVLAGTVGIGEKAALPALIVYGLLPVIRNTYVGIREVDPLIVESAIAMGVTDRQLLLKVQLPIALPVIFAGFRTMVVMTIALTGIASFIGAGGLGVAIWRGITTYFQEMTVAGSLLVAGLAIVTDLFLGWFEKGIRRRVLGEA